MGGRVLGPSDVRKNHATRLALIDPVSPWLSFLGHRFSCAPAAALNTCFSQVEQLCGKLGRRDAFELLSNSIEKFFSSPAASSATYEDFSLANIVYAGVAASHGFSLRVAATIMARTMDIPDNVLLNDDASLYLGAITSNRHPVCG